MGEVEGQTPRNLLGAPSLDPASIPAVGLYCDPSTVTPRGPRFARQVPSPGPTGVLARSRVSARS